MTGVVDGATFVMWRAHNREDADRFLIWIGDLTGVYPRMIRAATLNGSELTVECYTDPKRLNAAQTGPETYIRVFQLESPPPVWPEDWMLS
jgi:hypothetical protein